MSFEYARCVLVTGSRELKDVKLITSKLAEWYAEKSVDILIVGDCPTGADCMARDWAVGGKKPIRVFTADWKNLGRSAGPIRNQQMVSWAKKHCKQVDVLAFFSKEGKNIGTRNCAETARKAGASVYEF